jgi:hypothetical protein
MGGTKHDIMRAKGCSSSVWGVSKAIHAASPAGWHNGRPESAPLRRLGGAARRGSGRAPRPSSHAQRPKKRASAPAPKEASGLRILALAHSGGRPKQAPIAAASGARSPAQKSAPETREGGRPASASGAPGEHNGPRAPAPPARLAARAHQSRPRQPRRFKGGVWARQQKTGRATAVCARRAAHLEPCIRSDIWGVCERMDVGPAAVSAAGPEEHEASPRCPSALTFWVCGGSMVRSSREVQSRIKPLTRWDETATGGLAAGAGARLGGSRGPVRRHHIMVRPNEGDMCVVGAKGGRVARPPCSCQGAGVALRQPRQRLGRYLARLSTRARGCPPRRGAARRGTRRGTRRATRRARRHRGTAAAWRRRRAGPVQEAGGGAGGGPRQWGQGILCRVCSGLAASGRGAARALGRVAPQPHLVAAAGADEKLAIDLSNAEALAAGQVGEGREPAAGRLGDRKWLGRRARLCTGCWAWRRGPLRWAGGLPWQQARQQAARRRRPSGALVADSARARAEPAPHRSNWTGTPLAASAPPRRAIAVSTSSGLPDLALATRRATQSWLPAAAPPEMKTCCGGGEANGTGPGVSKGRGGVALGRRLKGARGDR